MSERTIETADLARPDAFTQASLGWVPWLEPLPKSEFTERHYEGLVERARADMPYFALLARDPDALKARTLTDLDIFHNEDGGVPRADREFAAAVASRRNGCVFCASVHARLTSQFTGRTDDVQRLLDDGVDAELDPRWRAIADAAVALTDSPSTFGAEHVAALRAQGLDDAGIADVISGAAFFNWANRLMLSLGEPTVPPQRAKRD
jgi:alkylhydroperoxidase domain protein